MLKDTNEKIVVLEAPFKADVMESCAKNGPPLLFAFLSTSAPTSWPPNGIEQRTNRGDRGPVENVPKPNGGATWANQVASAVRGKS